MVNTIIAILLLLTFVGFIFYIFKGGNLMVGFFVMAILWAVIGLVPFDVAIKKVFAEPALNYGPTIIYIRVLRQPFHNARRRQVRRM